MRHNEPGVDAGPAGAVTRAPVHPAVATVPLEGAANQLAALLARAARAPIGLVHIVAGTRQHLRGSHGLEAEWHSIADTPLADSITGLVVAAGAPLVIEDVQADNRLPDRCPVRERPGAFLGQPVRHPDGRVAGACCVYDHRPRRWGDDEIAAVAEAAMFGAQLVAEQLARREIEDSRAFLDTVLDSLHDGVSACDADGNIVLANRRMRALWGHAPAPATLDDPAALSGLHDRDGRPWVRKDLSLYRALRGERLCNEDVVWQGPGRKSRYYLIDAKPIARPDGSPAGAVMAVQDVTRQRRAERFRTCELAVTTALAETSSVEAAGTRVLEAVVGTLGWTHAELWLVDAAAGALHPAATWSTPGWSSHLCVPEHMQYGHGLAGRSWQAGKPLWIRDVGRPQSLISAQTAATSQLHTALAIPVRDGTDCVGVLTAFAETIEDPEDELVALMSGIAAHIGQFLERRLVEDLQRQLVRSKDEYLALIGHELRTPLTSISAYTGLLREADSATLLEQGPALLEVIDRNTTQLRQIIDELLELSALDTGHARVQTSPMDLAGLVRGCVAGARSAITDDALALTEELPDQLVVPGDEQWLRKVVDNLLGNAVKYSPDGGTITVRLRPVGRAAELTVADTGIGVDPQERQQMFSRLFRSARVRDRGIPGTGLGLALSRAVVERHHGTIEVVDRAEPGTMIRVRLPLDAR